MDIFPILDFLLPTFCKIKISKIFSTALFMFVRSSPCSHRPYTQTLTFWNMIDIMSKKYHSKEYKWKKDLAILENVYLSLCTEITSLSELRKILEFGVRKIFSNFAVLGDLGLGTNHRYWHKKQLENICKILLNFKYFKMRCSWN